MAAQTTTAAPRRRSAAVFIDRRALKLRRQTSGLTRAQLAEGAGISVGYIGHLESGRRDTVSPPVFVRICDTLAVSDRTELIDDTELDSDVAVSASGARSRAVRAGRGAR